MSAHTIEQLLRRQRRGMILIAMGMSVALSVGVVLAAAVLGDLDRGQSFWPLGGLLIVMITALAPGAWLAESAGARIRDHPSGAEYVKSWPDLYHAYAMFLIHVGLAGLGLAGIAMGLLVASDSTFPRGLVVVCSVIYFVFMAGGLLMLRLERHVK